MFNRKNIEDSRYQELLEKVESIEKELNETEECKEENNNDIFNYSFGYHRFNFKSETIGDKVKNLKELHNYIDDRLDQLTEYLGVEFVEIEEKISDGSDTADRTTKKKVVRLKDKKITRK